MSITLAKSVRLEKRPILVATFGPAFAVWLVKHKC